MYCKQVQISHSVMPVFSVTPVLKTHREKQGKAESESWMYKHDNLWMICIGLDGVD